MNKAKQVLKFLGVNSMIGGYVLQATAMRKIQGANWSNKKKTALLLRKYSKVGMKLLGFEVIQDGEVLDESEARLYVGNHLSYTDILAYSSFLPTCFVTSQEIRETPVLGYLCDVAGCLFVERRSRENLRKEVAQISEGLENGCNVVVYPEATSTNGDEVLRFKRPLFGSALYAGKKVQPFTINYETVDGEPVSPKNRDYLFWYGDMDFVPHLWELCGRDSVRVRLTFHKPLDSKEIDDVTLLASLSHEAVSGAFVSMKSETTTTPTTAGTSQADAEQLSHQASSASEIGSEAVSLI
ncbi:MAG: 1-acyl-sn-glycerol-3-phosphate acyltransferase [Bdellovibrionales bacterium]|nr:1-acyl-sn-glycerol-3-phosphate acyltransferase [Bdellovibrionales bacterium]